MPRDTQLNEVFVTGCFHPRLLGIWYPTFLVMCIPKSVGYLLPKSCKNLIWFGVTGHHLSKSGICYPKKLGIKNPTHSTECSHWASSCMRHDRTSAAAAISNEVPEFRMTPTFRVRYQVYFTRLRGSIVYIWNIFFNYMGPALCSNMHL